ncbi:unnamed protein product [Ostreobium quekettii]|uniref:WPP domain-containing protein n=1 Tax=Ostreobium quekettii TaxID=121088 RepID=A0A8S1J4A4_9CHLO|nr:unnamed protein product [Ostreobium quekettii]|eukprot:evm.model.scf_1661.1 EVM.evm.TU.scf_1661.1   scf_1661:847-6662(-)
MSLADIIERMNTAWRLTSEQRERIVSRVTSSIMDLSFFHGRPMEEGAAQKAAAAVEKKAHTAAEVQATTTTGARPKHEVMGAYAKKLGELLCEVVNKGGVEEHAGPTIVDKKLDLSGKRDFVTKEAAQQMFHLLLEEECAVEAVKLSNQSFGLEAAEVAAEALQHIGSKLTDADLSDIIAGRPEPEALDVLKKLSEALSGAHLKRLDLSHNALGAKGIRACAPLWKSQADLESISLGNIGCSADACVAVEELVVAEGLTSLTFFNNCSEDEGAKAIAKLLTRSPKMREFRMESSRVGPEGGMALVQGLCAGTCLVSLDISDNPMGAEVADGLAALLRQQAGLTSLIVSDTGLTAGGVKTLSQALLEGVPLLEILGIALVEMTADGARALAPALEAKKHLKRLYLRENELEDEGALVIAGAVAKISVLQELDIEENDMSDEGALAIAGSLKGKPDFKAVKFKDDLSKKGINELKEIVQEEFGNLNVLSVLPRDEE